MAAFVVTTGQDVVNANDGLLSLREAIAAAQSSGGADTIRFGDIDNDVVTLTSTLTIAAGNNVTIDGTTDAIWSRVTLDGGYTGDPWAGHGFTMVEVASGASVKFYNIDIANGFERGVDGIDGANGDDGLDGTDGDDITPNTGAHGSNGNGGTGGFSAINDGTMAVGGIENHGSLTLELVTLNANAFGGQGGDGGAGGHGGDGGDGGHNVDEGAGGSGGSGGPAGSGGNATSGGDAAGAIYNLGTLTLIDSYISGNAYAGDGGKGGKGGNGGNGGDGGDSSEGVGGHGGFGGEGGDSGHSGNGGDAAGGIFNLGTIISQGVSATIQGDETAGISTLVGGGASGLAGEGGDGAPDGDDGLPSNPGEPGHVGTNGNEAGSNHILGDDGDLTFSANTFVIQSVTQSVAEGGMIQLEVRRLGTHSITSSVAWSITGLGDGDFDASQAMSGTIEFGAFQTVMFLTVRAKSDGIAEEDEAFTVKLGQTSANAVLGTHSSVELTIEGEEGDNQAPTDLALSNRTVADDALAGAIIGKLSAEDPDGDTITYSLTADADGLFTIVGNELRLAQDMDPSEQHSFSVTVEASDGQGGVTSSAFVIRLDGYVDGNSKDNKLNGSQDEDHMFGYAGKDVLKGKGGDDYLVGGRHADMLYGGKGADHFVIERIEDSTAKVKGRDTIFDFDGKKGDRIDVSALSAAGDLELTFIGKQDFHKVGGEIRYEVWKGDATLYGDLDGNGKADVSVHLKNVTSLEEGWLEM